MKIVTAADRRMRRFASSCVKSAERLGYSVIVYDLGGLGFGKPFEMDHPVFRQKGYYRNIIRSLRTYKNLKLAATRMKGDHKPAIIKDTLRSHKEFIIYLDADTMVADRIDEMVGDYDIGLTVRPKWEVDKLIKGTYPDDYFIYAGYVNAGVMCFNATEAAYRFVERWEDRTKEVGDDQGAVNDMLKEYFPLKPGGTIEADGIKIRTFDTMRYNHYYFQWRNIDRSHRVAEEDIKVKWREAKILHFKGKIRSDYFRYFNEVMGRAR